MPADCELYYYIGIWENVKKNPRFSGENFRDLPPDAEKRVSFSPEMWYMKGWKSREDPDMTLLGTALFIFSAQLLAYTVKGLIGFGNPLISAPILSLGLDNAVIMHDGAIISKEGMRHPEEFARHKMMDLVGDLFLTGMRVHAKVTAEKAGHPTHVKLATEMLAQWTANKQTKEA